MRASILGIDIHDDLCWRAGPTRLEAARSGSRLSASVIAQTSRRYGTFAGVFMLALLKPNWKALMSPPAVLSTSAS
eukprot:910424-Pleurochrysis_carterae.AAC.1